MQAGGLLSAVGGGSVSSDPQVLLTARCMPFFILGCQLSGGTAANQVAALMRRSLKLMADVAGRERLRVLLETFKQTCDPCRPQLAQVCLCMHLSL